MVAFIHLLAQTDTATWDAIKSLGIPVACVCLGAAGVFKFGVVYERRRADAAAEREREAYALTTPALIRNNDLLQDVLEWVREVKRGHSS